MGFVMLSVNDEVKSVIVCVFLLVSEIVMFYFG